MTGRRGGRIRSALIISVLVGTSVVASAQAATVLLGDQLLEAKHDQNVAGKAEAFRTTATTSGTLTKLTVYVESTSAATKLNAGIYADANGHPGSLLGQGMITAVVKGTWNDVPISAAAVSAGSVYWIAILSPTSTGTLQFREAAAGASEGSASSTLTALPATWASGARYTDGPLSAYGSGDTSVTPMLQVSPLTVSFGAQVGGSDPAAAQVSVANTGGGSLLFSAASDSPWLTVSPTSGGAPQTLQLSASIASLSAGTYTGHVTVTSDGTTGSPATVTVTLQVAPPTPPSPLDWPQVDYNAARTGTAAGETIISPSNASTLRRSWATVLDAKITAQPLFLKQVTVGGQLHDIVVAATNGNSVYALDAGSGAILWRKNFGSQAAINAIPGGFGVGASPAADKANGRIYVVSDDGRLHGLSMTDGSDAVTPLTLISGPTTNKVWGGLNLNGSDLYIATASDGSDSPPWRGRVYHVSVAGNALQLAGTWDVVPSIAPPSGGGGIWGYGGVSVDTSTGNVYATPGADSAEQYTPYANRIVALSGSLSLLGSYLPPEPTTFPCSGAPCDLDFGATPVVFHPTDCPTLTAVGNKNGNLYVTGRASSRQAGLRSRSSS